jgi:hypothetical protein
MTRVTTEMNWTGREWIVRLIADGTPVLDMTLDEFIALPVTQYVLEEAEQERAEAARYAKRTRVDHRFRPRSRQWSTPRRRRERSARQSTSPIPAVSPVIRKLRGKRTDRNPSASRRARAATRCRGKAK